MLKNTIYENLILKIKFLFFIYTSMKHIKTYEELNIDEPQVGDYILVEDNFLSSYIKDFLENNIGIIKNITPTNIYQCKYPNNDGNWRLNKSQIKYWSKNRESLEDILATNKYNL
jgi:hypothetical protein